MRPLGWRAMPLVGQGVVALLGGALLVPAAARAGSNELVSVSSAGVVANAASGEPSVSADGRFVAFSSFASNLVAGDTNGQGPDPCDPSFGCEPPGTDVFVRDRTRRVTTRVSVDSAGRQADYCAVRINGTEFYPAAGSFTPALSADGRFVAFVSCAANLTTTPISDYEVFVHDLLTGLTEAIGPVAVVDTPVTLGISDDGRFVAFAGSDPATGWQGVFVRDRRTGATELVSVTSSGAPADYNSLLPALSGDGRVVAFVSGATNLAPGDTNGEWDVFLHDRRTGVTSRASVSTTGQEANGGSWGQVSLSRSGRYVAFESLAANLVPRDTNGDPTQGTGQDVFVRDRRAGTTERVNVSSGGVEAGPVPYGGTAFSPPLAPGDGASMSADGRLVAFWSGSTNLVHADTNACRGGYRGSNRYNCPDVFAHQRAGRTVRISVSSSGIQARGDSFSPAISADGSVIAFVSNAANLITGGTGTCRDNSGTRRSCAAVILHAR